MNKSVKKIISSIIIFAVTLGVGFALTMLSFNIFGAVSVNEMRILFCIDIAILAIIGAVAYLIYDSKQAQKRKDALLKERHNQRVRKRNSEIQSLSGIISQSNFAA